MGTQNTTTNGNKNGVALMALAIVIAVGGVLAFALLTEQSTMIRVGVLLGSLVVGCVLGWLSAPGKELVAYCRSSYEELRRVVWPTRKETINTTGIVCAFVVVIAFFLFLVDKLIEVLLYDVLLTLF